MVVSAGETRSQSVILRIPSLTSQMIPVTESLRITVFRFTRGTASAPAGRSGISWIVGCWSAQTVASREPTTAYAQGPTATGRWTTPSGIGPDSDRTCFGATPTSPRGVATRARSWPSISGDSGIGLAR